MNSLDILINKDRKSYLCFEILKELYNNNPEFKKLVDEGIKEGKISGFPDELWIAIDNQNVRGLKSFENVFRDGYNIGGQTVVSRQLSYSFPTCTLCSGTLPLIAGTKNSPSGEHSWMTSDGLVYDTTLMLVMDRTYSSKLGYQYEMEYDPSEDPIYSATQEFTNDKEQKNGRRR